jgi:hypothetical protein
MNFEIIDSASGDVLGRVIIASMEDEEILQILCDKGYLSGSPEYYEITRSYPFAEGDIVVLDLESQVPVLALAEPELNNKAA